MCVVVQKQWLQRKYALGSSGPDSSYQNTKAFAYTCTNAKKIWVYVWQARAGCGDTKKNDSWSKVSNVNYFMDFDLRVSMRGAHMWAAILTITFPYSIAYASNVYSILWIQSFALHRLSIRSAIQFFFSLFLFLLLFIFCSLLFLLNWFQVCYTSTWRITEIRIGFCLSHVSLSHLNLCLCHLLPRFHVLSESLLFFHGASLPLAPSPSLSLSVSVSRSRY